MPQLPPSAWAVIAGVGLLLVGLVGATAYGVLRRQTRERIAPMAPGRIAALVALAAVPWMVVWVASYSQANVNVSAHSITALVLWAAAALLVFALLVLVPVAALLALVTWLATRPRRATP